MSQFFPYIVHALAHNLLHSPTLSHSLIYSLTYPSFIYSLTHLFTHPLTHLLTYPLTHSLTYPLTHLLTYPLFIHSLTHSLIYSLTRSLTHISLITFPTSLELSLPLIKVIIMQFPLCYFDNQPRQKMIIFFEHQR